MQSHRGTTVGNEPSAGEVPKKIKVEHLTDGKQKKKQQTERRRSMAQLTKSAAAAAANDAREHKRDDGVGNSRCTHLHGRRWQPQTGRAASATPANEGEASWLCVADNKVPRLCGRRSAYGVSSQQLPGRDCTTTSLHSLICPSCPVCSSKKKECGTCSSSSFSRQPLQAVETCHQIAPRCRPTCCHHCWP